MRADLSVQSFDGMQAPKDLLSATNLKNAHVNITYGVVGGCIEFSVFNTEDDEHWLEVLTVKLTPINS